MTSIKDFKLAPLSPVPSDIEVGGACGIICIYLRMLYMYIHQPKRANRADC